MASLYLNGLTQDKREDLIERLHASQGGRCFICEKPIDLVAQASSIDVDHIEPLNNGGKDGEGNFAVTHASCNRSKQAADLRVARVLAKFSQIQAEVQQSAKRGVNLSDIFARYGGASQQLGFKIADDAITYSHDELGDATRRAVPLYTDRLGGLRYFSALLPIEYLHHDDRINPRNIGANLSRLVTEFHRGRPQLHVSLGWLTSAAGRGQIKVFDGQHKATAQVLLGSRELPVRVFVDPDADVLLEANTNAGTTLRQVTFDKAVQRRLGSTLFRGRLERYREQHGLPDDAEDFSEKDLYNHFKGESRDIKRYIIDNQRSQIISHPDNKLVEFIEYAGKGLTSHFPIPRSRRPSTASSFTQTFWKLR